MFQMDGTTPSSELLMKIEDLLVLGAHLTDFIVFGKQSQCGRTTTRLLLNYIHVRYIPFTYKSYVESFISI